MQIVLQHVSVPRAPGEESAEAARKFYGRLVGLKEKPVPTTIKQLDLVWFKIGEETELHVFAEKDSPTTSTRHFCLNVGDVEAMRQALIRGGIRAVEPGSNSRAAPLLLP